MWAAVKEERREKRWRNYENSMAILRREGIPFKILDVGTGHLRVGDFDFWPTTGKYCNQREKLSGRGVFSLIGIIQGKKRKEVRKP